MPYNIVCYHCLYYLEPFCNCSSNYKQELGITALHIKLHAIGRNKTKTPGLGAQASLRALAHSGMKIGRIGKDVKKIVAFRTEEFD